MTRAAGRTTRNRGRTWVWCRESGCDTKLIFATRNGTRRPYEHTDRPPFSVEATGCHVIVAGQAFTPREAIEHFAIRFEVPEDKARDLVEGYPFHRPHTHDPSPTTADNRGDT